MAETVQISQGFPKNIVQRADDFGVEYDLQLYVAAPFDTARAAFPSLGDTESVWGLVDGAKVLAVSMWTGAEHNSWTYCDLHCGTSSDYWATALEDGGLQRPLEFHADYRTKWNYHLAMKEGTSTHSAWATATDVTLSEADAKIKRWIKEPTEAQAEWKILSGFAKTKPGVDQFISPSPVVRQFKRYCTEPEAFAASLDYPVGTVYKSTGNITLTGMVWLVMSSGYAFDGLYWRHIMTMQASSQWDEDLYGASKNFD